MGKLINQGAVLRRKAEIADAGMYGASGGGVDDCRIGRALRRSLLPAARSGARRGGGRLAGRRAAWPASSLTSSTGRVAQEPLAGTSVGPGASPTHRLRTPITHRRPRFGCFRPVFTRLSSRLPSPTRGKRDARQAHTWAARGRGRIVSSLANVKRRWLRRTRSDDGPAAWVAPHPPRARRRSFWVPI